jgi:hypothetical protein
MRRKCLIYPQEKIARGLSKLHAQRLPFVILLVALVTGYCLFQWSFSFYVTNVLIKNKGQVSPIFSTKFYSEVRVMFVHCLSFPANWTAIAECAKQYNFTVVNVECLSCQAANYNSDYVWNPTGTDELSAALRECHARGLKVWVNFDVLSSPGSHTELKARDVNGSILDWTCPSNPLAREHLYNLTRELITKFPELDGMMLDYIRYDTAEMCYCEHCRNAFIEDTGLTDTVWPTDVYWGGKYRAEFMEWRVKKVTEIVEMIRSTILAVKPNFEFAVAAWAIFDEGAGPYWRYWIGQDVADWVNKGWIDYVSPMIYITDWSELDHFKQTVNCSINVFVGSPQGKVQIIPSITTGLTEPVDPDLFKAEINYLRQIGCNGFQVWRYGGEGSTHSVADVRNYLSFIDLPETYLLGNINVSIENTTATITWITTKPATSKVEYAILPLFNASYIYKADINFHYWDIEYTPGMMIENSTISIYHKVTLYGLAPESKYYFRVQSKNSLGIVTSNELTFTTG